MTGIATSTTNGTKLITVRGLVDSDQTVRLRAVLLDAVWRERSPLTVVELTADVTLDGTAIGALVAATAIAEDRQLFLDVRCANSDLAGQLADAGVRRVVWPTR